MAQFTPKFEYLKDCKPGQLVRLKDGEETCWAITCQDQGSFVRPILVMSPTGVKTVNIKKGGRISGECDDVPVLVYGPDFSIEPDHTGQIILVAYEMPKTPGRLLLAKSLQEKEEELYVVAAGAESGLMDYVAVADAMAYSEPGGHRALYSRWRLTHKQITRDGVPQTLFEFDATKLAQRLQAVA